MHQNISQDGFARFARLTCVALAATLILSAISMSFASTAHAQSSEEDAFDSVWARTDHPVSDHDVGRTWMWGPESFSGVLDEQYSNSPEGSRSVAYFDKARMETNGAGGDANDSGDVTFGLLARDLVRGQVQIGDTEYQDHSPPEINVVGDREDELAPTYQTFSQVMSAEPLSEGETIVQTIDRAGDVGHDDALAAHNVTVSHIESATNHSVASVFWDFMNSEGPIWLDGEMADGPLFESPYYATGYPITEPYWATVAIGGEAQEVLVQVFERRVLSYTPDNPDGWQVEAGNVGQHFYYWKYDMLEADRAVAEATSSPEPAAIAEPASSPEPVANAEAACLDASEQEFLQLINEYRANHGVAPLENSETLNLASYGHSLDMGQQAYFAHDALDGRTAWDRMREAGYDYNTTRAENIAAGQQTAQRVFEAWRDSPGHNANMLHPDVNAIGIARVEVPGSPFGVYWTTKFGGHIDAAPGC